MGRYDVLVLGGGVAGVGAALAAAGRCRVALIDAGHGATSLAAGGWAGPLPEALGAALAAAGLPHEPVSGPLPHPFGGLHAYDRAPPAHAAAVPAEDALVCGIAGLPGFEARPLARLWGDAAGRSLAAEVVPAARETPAGGWSPAALAAALEREPGPLADALARAVHAAGASRAILPAVLGIDGAEPVRAALAAAAGVPVGEALGTPPSLPGWRLARALRAALDAAGIVVHAGRVAGAEAAGGRITAVRIEPGNGAAAGRLEARAFVLATGKYAAGGIRAGARFEEPALGCPVRVEHLGQTFDSPDTLALTHPERTREQPLLSAGVHADAEGRPVGADGDVVYDNVRVAGSVRAGREAATPGLGHAAEDGWRAGERAAAEALA